MLETPGRLEAAECRLGLLLLRLFRLDREDLEVPLRLLLLGLLTLVLCLALSLVLLQSASLGTGSTS